VALLMGAMEVLGEVAAERDRQLEGLASVAEIRLSAGRQLARFVERDDERPDMVETLVARDEPERREDAGGLRHEYRPDLELVGERTGVQRARAAVGDEREVARVETALYR